MTRLLVAVVALSTLGYLGYRAMYKTKVDALEDRAAHAPKRQLDNVREKARELELKSQQNMDAVEKKLEP